MPLDPAKAREALAFAVFRAAGVPAPRTAFAEVTLTVPGKYDKEYLGLFTVVENVDKRFLADRFGTDKGLLMKPFQLRGIDLPRRRLGALQGRSTSRSREATKDEAKRVIDVREARQPGRTTTSSRSRSIRTSTWTSSCGSWPPTP